MPITRLTIVTFVAVLTSAAAAAADPPAPPSAHPPSAPESPRPVYRFDITVRRPDDAPNARVATYTVHLEEYHTGSVSMGANVPLMPTSAASGIASPRQDVGLMMRFSFVLRGSVVVLNGSFEMSSAETSAGSAATIHRIRAEGDVPLTAGHATLFASLTDTATRRPYEITVTATRAY